MTEPPSQPPPLPPPKNYWVARNGVKIGKFMPSNFMLGVQSGKIRQDDWFWMEGMSEWKRVSELKILEKLYPPSRREVTRMMRMLVKANECYNRGKSRRAADLAHRGALCFDRVPEEAMTPEVRRLGSDLSACAALAYGRLNNFLAAEMWARSSLKRDGTNPFAYEALGLGLAMNGHTDDARTKFMEGLRLAREAQPVDTEAEERINKQLLWLNEHESEINNLYRLQERLRRLQQAAVTAARTELEKEWCTDVISSYKTPADRSIVTMALAAYILFVMERAFSKVFSSDQATDAASLVISDFATQPWCEPRAFSRIAEKVFERGWKGLR